MVKDIHEAEPTCFEHALGNNKWEDAMDEEMASLDANETWELVVPLPKEKKAVLIQTIIHSLGEERHNIPSWYQELG